MDSSDQYQVEAEVKTNPELLGFDFDHVDWMCCDLQFHDHPSLLAHLSTVHGLNPPISANRLKLAKFDQPDQVVTIYEVKMDEVVLIQTETRVRVVQGLICDKQTSCTKRVS